MKKFNNKGQVLNQIGMIGIGIALLVIVMTVVFLINSNLRDVIVGDITPTAVTNETVLWVNNTYVALSHTGHALLSCGTVYNASDGAGGIISSSYYTCTPDKGIKVTTTNISTANITGYINVSYTYSEGDAAFNSTESMNNDTFQLVGWVGLVVIVLIGVLILGLVRQIRQ